jgi:hypothetical protein
VYQRLRDEHGAQVAESTVRAKVAQIKAALGDCLREVTIPQVHGPGEEAEQRPPAQGSKPAARTRIPAGTLKMLRLHRCQHDHRFSCVRDGAWWNAAVPSSALTRWQRERSVRLDKLFEAHVRIGGTRPGRRALADEQINQQINAALVLQLSAEFQGFARELYDELADAVMRATARRVEPGIVVVLQRYFVEPRALDRGNAHPGALGSDFRRFGVELWPRMIARDQRTKTRQAHLDRLNQARNAIAHSDEGELAKLRRDGIRITMATARTWRRALDQLALSMDASLEDYFTAAFGGQRPWKG